MRESRRPRPTTREHRAALVENLRKAWVAPRRKPFVVTRARRRAWRRNLQKAYAARRRKPLVYVRTARRLESARESLRRINASGASRGHGFQHGLAAASLRATLESAGETPAQFDAHLKRFVLAFASPQACRPPGRVSAHDVRLVRGGAEALWRRLRAYRSLGRWERRRVLKVFAQYADGTATAERAANFAVDLMLVLLDFAELSQSVVQLNRRLEDIFRELLTRRFRHDPGFCVFHIFHRKHPRLKGLPAEIIGNPLEPPKQLAALLQHAAEMPGRRASPAPLRRRDVFPAEEALESPRRLARLLGRALLPSPARDNPELRRRLLGLAEVLRRRLELFLNWAQWERRLVKGLLNVGGKAAPLSERQATILAGELLESLSRDDQLQLLTPQVNACLQELLVGLLREVYGNYPALKALSIAPRRAE
jgi:hypothetical protein